jgi:porphobilinogen deaminase
LAVHSLKDLPTDQPRELKVAAVTRRAPTGDCLLIHANRYSPGKPLGLPRGARVGTSSLRREAQLLNERSDLDVVPVRGNVPSRIKLAREGAVDAVILAQAGLSRSFRWTSRLARSCPLRDKGLWRLKQGFESPTIWPTQCEDCWIRSRNWKRGWREVF